MSVFVYFCLPGSSLRRFRWRPSPKPGDFQKQEIYKLLHNSDIFVIISWSITSEINFNLKKCLFIPWKSINTSSSNYQWACQNRSSLFSLQVQWQQRGHILSPRNRIGSKSLDLSAGEEMAMEVTVRDKAPLVLKLNKYHLLAFEMAVQEKNCHHQ